MYNFLFPVILSYKRFSDFLFGEKRIFFLVAVGISVNFAVSLVPKFVKVDIRDVDSFTFAGFHNERVA